MEVTIPLDGLDLPQSLGPRPPQTKGRLGLPQGQVSVLGMVDSLLSPHEFQRGQSVQKPADAPLG